MRGAGLGGGAGRTHACLSLRCGCLQFPRASAFPWFSLSFAFCAQVPAELGSVQSELKRDPGELRPANRRGRDCIAQRGWQSRGRQDSEPKGFSWLCPGEASEAEYSG